MLTQFNSMSGVSAGNKTVFLQVEHGYHASLNHKILICLSIVVALYSVIKYSIYRQFWFFIYGDETDFMNE